MIWKEFSSIMGQLTNHHVHVLKCNLSYFLLFCLIVNAPQDLHTNLTNYHIKAFQNSPTKLKNSNHCTFRIEKRSLCSIMIYFSVLVASVRKCVSSFFMKRLKMKETEIFFLDAILMVFMFKKSRWFYFLTKPILFRI